MRRSGKYLAASCAVCKNWKLPIIGNSTRFLHESNTVKTLCAFCKWLNMPSDNDFICDGFNRRGKCRERR